MTFSELKQCIKTEAFSGGIRTILQWNRRAVLYVRIMQYFYSKKNKLSSLLSVLLQNKLNKRGICIAPSCIIGKGFRIEHTSSIVIGAAVVIGENFSIYQNTTIGSARLGDAKRGLQPHLGNNVTLFANSMILGNVLIGDNVVIASHSLVLCNVPSGELWGGIPSKFIKSI